MSVVIKTLNRRKLYGKLVSDNGFYFEGDNPSFDQNNFLFLATDETVNKSDFLFTNGRFLGVIFVNNEGAIGNLPSISGILNDVVCVAFDPDTPTEMNGKLVLNSVSFEVNGLTRKYYVWKGSWSEITPITDSKISEDLFNNGVNQISVSPISVNKNVRPVAERSYLTLVDNPETKIYFDEVAPEPDWEPQWWIDILCNNSDTPTITLGSLTYEKSSISSIVLRKDVESVTSIGEGFLSDCVNLTSLDLSPLSRVTSIEGGFLYNCSSLTSLDLSPLSSVASIGFCFLLNCRSLTSLDLSPLSGITSITNQFLSNCRSLTSLDLSPLSNVTSIERRSFCNCQGLTSIKMMNNQALPEGIIVDGTFSQIPAATPIQVPSSKLEAYKTRFPGRVSQFQPYDEAA